MKRISSIAALLVCVASAGEAQVDGSLLSGMKARSIGPAGMSGRVSSIDVVVADPNIIYVGSATGGVWKSGDGGLTWTPIFDEQGTSSIGAVAVFQANPDVVWVGTGEGNPRNSAGVGNGIYKSIDGGQTWSHVGLEQSERIHRVVLHPTNQDVAYVGALGPSWSDGDERGVFKTVDGGQSWERVLFVNSRTGAADLVMDPSNPNKLIAAMWEYRRWPWFFESGGPGSGLHVTHDGGANWTRLGKKDGMPAGNLGRSGLAFAQNVPNVVYALVEAEESALLRSDDGGRTWRTLSDEPGIAPRPFYYADIRVDPLNENRLYSIHGRATVTEDGGKTFRTIVPSSIIHGDVHELWIHPMDNRLMLMGNDGGVGITYDRGEHWRFVENLPLAQFYHINVDMDTPYNVYGGLQDNGSWLGPSQVWNAGGIRNYYWLRVGSGDGFATLTNFADSRYGYSMSQQGRLRRFDKVTGERKDIQPVHPDGMELRFNWNAAINVDPFDSTTIYFGSQFVHRTGDAGETWQIISPDLTTNDPDKQRADESGGLTRDASGAENHTTILTIAPSAVERGVIWAGTDDGNVHITRDGGGSWTNLIDRIRGVPPTTWVPHIEPSGFDGGTAFVVFDDHRRGNWTTYVYKTTDYGRSWRSLGTDDISGFVHVIEQDPVEPRLLYLGTEFGLYVSLNDGASWSQWTHGFPTAPVRGLIVHPREHDLVIGTHGRGVFVLDDVRPLRALARNPALHDREVHVFDAPPAIQYRVAEAVGYRSTGHAMFFGENRPYGAMLSYWLGESAGDDSADVTIEISDAQGEVIRELEGSGHRGLNRVAWDLEREGFESPTSTGTSTESGPAVLPGRYTVTVKSGEAAATGTIEIVPDPRLSISAQSRSAKYAAMVRVGEQGEVAAEAVKRIRNATKGIDAVLERLEDRDDSTSAALAREGAAVKDTLAAVSAAFVNPPARQGLFTSRHTLEAKLNRIYGSLETSWDAPTDAQRISMEQVEALLETSLENLNRVFTDYLRPFAQRVAAGVDVLPTPEPLSLEWKKPKG